MSLNKLKLERIGNPLKPFWKHSETFENYFLIFLKQLEFTWIPMNRLAMQKSFKPLKQLPQCPEAFWNTLKRAETLKISLKLTFGKLAKTFGNYFQTHLKLLKVPWISFETPLTLLWKPPKTSCNPSGIPWNVLKRPKDPLKLPSWNSLKVSPNPIVQLTFGKW